MKNMKSFIILGCLIMGMVTSQLCNSNYDKTYVGFDLSFNFTGESDRQISSLVLDLDAKYLYGTSHGSFNSQTESIILFKLNAEFEVQWIKETSENVTGKIELDIDSTGTYLYLKSVKYDTMISKIEAQDGTLVYSRRHPGNSERTVSVAYSDDYQFAYLMINQNVIFGYNIDQDRYFGAFFLLQNTALANETASPQYLIRSISSAKFVTTSTITKGLIINAETNENIQRL